MFCRSGHIESGGGVYHYPEIDANDAGKPYYPVLTVLRLGALHHTLQQLSADGFGILQRLTRRVRTRLT
jgi:hypothetical protein